MPRRTKGPAPKGRRIRRLLIRFGWLLPVGALLIGGGVLATVYVFASVPLPAQVKLASAAQVFDRDGELIGVYAGDERRFLIDSTKLPDFVGEAVVAAEDRDFYEHSGISLRGIARAAWANLTGGSIQQGGSTITQQYIKNAVLSDPERTVTRKVKEAILAIKLERRFSKDEILDFYLNTIYLGRGAYGIEAAARAYFDKHATQLTLSEAAYLAGIIPSPESYQPDDDQARARARRDGVLDQLVAEGYVEETAARRASRGPVRLAKSASKSAGSQRAAYFMEWLRKDYLDPEFGNRLYTSGFEIHTTLDLDTQAEAEAAVAATLTERGDPQAALVSMTPEGAVRAMVGGRSFTNVTKARGFNFATDNLRQPGSAFKPFTLLKAIERGISPDSTFSGASPATIDDPICDNEDGTPWQPENYGDASYGTVTLDEATTNSINTVYAQLIAEMNPAPVADLLEDFGFHDADGGRDIAPLCSLALGGSIDVTPLQMARAYAGFTARGMLPEVSPVLYVEDSDGDCVREYRPGTSRECAESRVQEAERVVKTNSADVLNEVLTHVVEGGTATAASIGRPVAGKTGTTQNNVNAWFAGSVPQLTTVVWMGYPKALGKELVPEMRFCADLSLCRPVHGIEVTGGSFPAEIWADFMRAATADLPVAQFPEPAEIPDELLNSPEPADVPPPTPVESPTSTPSPSPSPTSSPSPSPSPTPTPTPSETPSPSPTPTTPSPSPPAPDPTEAPGGDETVPEPPEPSGGGGDPPPAPRRGSTPDG